MMRLAVILLGLCFLCSICFAADSQTKPSEQKTKESYSLGYDFGSNLRNRDIDVDRDVLISALKDGLLGSKPAMSREEIRETLMQLRKRVVVLQNRKLEEMRVKNLAAGRAFMKANEAKEGVRTLQSGLQYVILKEGSGPSPKETDTVRVNYRGTLIDGTEFDSSYEKGGSAVIPVAGVIKGWTEALQLMKAGSKWRIFVPEKLAYGQRQYGKIPPNSTLIFDLELLSLGDPLVPVLEEPQLSGK